MFPNQIPAISGSEPKLIHRSRKRTHEPERTLRSGRQREISRSSVIEASDLVSLFQELAFDELIEKINVKDMICQEFIDRIGKLYKPVLMEQNSRVNAASIKKRSKDVNVAMKLRCEGERFKEYQASKNKPLIDYNISSYFQEEMLKHCSEDLHLPFGNFEDMVMGLAVIYFGEAFAHNESLNRILCEYINTMSNKTVGNVFFDEECEYDSDICLGNHNVQKGKRRKVMSLCPLFN